MFQAISEERWGYRGGDRAARLMHNSMLGTDTVTQLGGIREHERILRQLPGAVISMSLFIRHHVRRSVRPTVRPSVTQDDPISLCLASDKHGDKKNKHGRFVDDLEITYRDVVACVRDIYSRDR